MFWFRWLAVADNTLLYLRFLRRPSRGHFRDADSRVRPGVPKQNNKRGSHRSHLSLLSIIYYICYLHISQEPVSEERLFRAPR